MEMELKKKKKKKHFLYVIYKRQEKVIESKYRENIIHCYRVMYMYTSINITQLTVNFPLFVFETVLNE